MTSWRRIVASWPSLERTWNHQSLSIFAHLWMISCVMISINRSSRLNVYAWTPKTINVSILPKAKSVWLIFLSVLYFRTTLQIQTVWAYYLRKKSTNALNLVLECKFSEVSILDSNLYPALISFQKFPYFPFIIYSHFLRYSFKGRDRPFINLEDLFVSLFSLFVSLQFITKSFTLTAQQDTGCLERRAKTFLFVSNCHQIIKRNTTSQEISCRWRKSFNVAVLIQWNFETLKSPKNEEKRKKKDEGKCWKKWIPWQ